MSELRDEYRPYLESNISRGGRAGCPAQEGDHCDCSGPHVCNPRWLLKHGSIADVIEVMRLHPEIAGEHGDQHHDTPGPYGHTDAHWDAN